MAHTDGVVRHISVRHQQQHRLGRCHHWVGGEPEEDQVCYSNDVYQPVEFTNNFYSREIIGLVLSSRFTCECLLNFLPALPRPTQYVKPLEGAGLDTTNHSQTRVGEGIFKTEDVGEEGQKLQQIGREWGVSTGRKRRCGWLDLVVLKYSASVNYYTAWNLTSMFRMRLASVSMTGD